MEFIERIPADRLHFLKTLTYKDFRAIDKGAKNEEERKKNYEKMRSFCDHFLKANGEIKRLYKYTGANNWTETGEGSGRLFAHAGGIQGLVKVLRGFLTANYTSDIDMVNAHPVILQYICRLHNVPCEELSLYINNRDQILAQFADREEGKKAFLKATNNDKLNRKTTNEVLKRYDREMKETQKMITRLTCYERIVADVPENRLYNWYGSAINRVLCFYENKVLQVILDELNRRRVEIMAPMFDGCLVYGEVREDTLRELEEAIEAQFPGMGMRLSLKEPCADIQMPADFVVPDSKAEVKEKLRTFDKMAAEFERTHCKIVNKALYIKETEEGPVLMTEKSVRAAYVHMTYDVLDKDGEVKKENFIHRWLVNNDEIRKYTDAGMYPPGLECPPDRYNLWVPFAMERVAEYKHKEEELQLILTHIKILCNHEEAVATFLVNWIAQMVQYPAVKTLVPTFIAKQGAGKGTLVRLMERMLGGEKVFATQKPARDVWGEFNPKMQNAFLVVLDELSKKDQKDAEGAIKGLITEPRISISKKGVDTFEIPSFHRFMAPTNGEEPWYTSDDDRRNAIIRCSDELIGNKEYFDRFYAMLDDVNVVKTFYEYLKAIPGMDRFNHLPVPRTEHHQNLIQLSVPPIERWLEALTIANLDKEELVLTGVEACRQFQEWCADNSASYDISPTKLGVRLSNARIPGITKGQKTRQGETKRYNIAELRRHFKLESLI